MTILGILPPFSYALTTLSQNFANNPDSLSEPSGQLVRSIGTTCPRYADNLSVPLGQLDGMIIRKAPLLTEGCFSYLRK